MEPASMLVATTSHQGAGSRLVPRCASSHSDTSGNGSLERRYRLSFYRSGTVSTNCDDRILPLTPRPPLISL